MRKSYFNAVLIMFILLVLSGCGGAFDFDYKPTGTIIKETQEPSGLIFLGEYYLCNNCWNQNGANGPYIQQVFQEDIGGTTAVGWRWRCPNGNTVVGYPEFIWGGSPWGVPNYIDFTPQPFPVGSKKVTINFDVNLQAKGTYNMAFSTWTVSSLTENAKQSIRHEIMIWNYVSGMVPSGTVQGTYADATTGITFDVYVDPNHEDASGANPGMKWSYVAFYPNRPFLNGPLVLSDFIGYLVGQGIIPTSPTLYVTHFELGNEVINGSGIAEVTGYSIALEDI